MKKLFASGIACLLACSVSLAGYSFSTVGTTPVAGIPAPTSAGSTNTYAWSMDTAYAAGESAFIGSSRYVTPYGGTSSNGGTGPVETGGDITEATGLVWRKALGVERKLLVICNDGAARVFCSTNSGGVGFSVNAGESKMFDLVVPQTRFWFTTTNDVTDVRVLEQ